MIGQNRTLAVMEKALCLKRQCGFIFNARVYYSHCFKTALGYFGSTIHEISKSDEGWKDCQDTERSSHDFARELQCVNSNLTPRRANVKRDITKRKLARNTQTVAKRVSFAFTLVTYFVNSHASRYN